MNELDILRTQQENFAYGVLKGLYWGVRIGQLRDNLKDPLLGEIHRYLIVSLRQLPQLIKDELDEAEKEGGIKTWQDLELRKFNIELKVASRVYDYIEFLIRENEEIYGDENGRKQ